jgi:hypothetical protein
MAKKTEKPERLDMHRVIQIHMVTEGEGTLGWVHTHGMHVLDLPELEVRNVPLFLSADAGKLLNLVAQYLFDGKYGYEDAKPVNLGEVMATGPFQRFKFVKLDPIPGQAEHYEVERWTLSDEPMRTLCHAPGCTENHPHG